MHDTEGLLSVHEVSIPSQGTSWTALSASICCLGLWPDRSQITHAVIIGNNVVSLSQSKSLEVGIDWWLLRHALGI